MSSSDKIDSPREPAKITAQIAHLKAELTESYEIFTKVRDALSNITFTNLGANGHRKLDDYKYDVNEMAMAKNFDKSILTLNEGVTREISDFPKMLERVPELNVFYQAMNDLKRGMEKMDLNSKQFSDLDAEVNEEIDKVVKRTTSIRDELEKVDEEMVKEAIRIYEKAEEKEEISTEE